MQITLQQQHIEAAIKAYVAKAGITFPIDKVAFTAGRGSSGLTASIEMADPFAAELPGESEGEDQPAPQKAEPKASKPKPASKQAVLETPETAQDDEPETQAQEPEGESDVEQDDGDSPTEPVEPPKKASLFGG